VSRLSKSRFPPLLCYVTDRRRFSSNPAEARDALLQKIEAAAAAGVEWIQIREKDLSGKECGLLTRETLQCAVKFRAPNKSNSRILVNDRLDVALAERADGVHLGENTLPVKEAKRLLESRLAQTEFLVGVSCHSLESARSAERDGADYLIFGPVLATPSKAAYGAPQGIERLGEVCRSVAIPVLAIGGITVENAASCFAVGATGIAAIRLFQDTPDIPARVHALRNLAP
jgi:thiamine-phosphate pyrophosphorylase